MLTFSGTVSSTEVSRVFDLTNSQTEVLLEVLASLSLSNNPASPTPIPSGSMDSSPTMQVSFHFHAVVV